MDFLMKESGNISCSYFYPAIFQAPVPTLSQYRQRAPKDAHKHTFKIGWAFSFTSLCYLLTPFWFMGKLGLVI